MHNMHKNRLVHLPPVLLVPHFVLVVHWRPFDHGILMPLPPPPPYVTPTLTFGAAKSLSESEESDEFCESSASRSLETAVNPLFRIRSIRSICSISRLSESKSGEHPSIAFILVPSPVAMGEG